MHTQLKHVLRAIGILALIAIPIQALAQQPAAPTTPPATYQPQNHEGVGVGAKIGPLFASFDEAGEDFSNRTGFIGGLFLGGNRAGVVGVGVDLLYARKGTKDADGTFTYDLDYINVPVYARINAGSSSRSSVSGFGIVGVDLNFLLKARAKSGSSSVDIKDNFSRADYGLALGFGVEITRFIVEARFTKGIASIAKNKNDPELKTQTFAVMFGVRFN